MAAQFDVLFGVRPENPTETPAAIVARESVGARWTVSDRPSAISFHARRCTLDYEADRFANRPRVIHVELDDGKRTLRSRAPECSPSLHGLCLDFFGGAASVLCATSKSLTPVLSSFLEMQKYAAFFCLAAGLLRSFILT